MKREGSGKKGRRSDGWRNATERIGCIAEKPIAGKVSDDHDRCIYCQRSVELLLWLTRTPKNTIFYGGYAERIRSTTNPGETTTAPRRDGAMTAPRAADSIGN